MIVVTAIVARARQSTVMVAHSVKDPSHKTDIQFRAVDVAPLSLSCHPEKCHKYSKLRGFLFIFPQYRRNQRSHHLELLTLSLLQTASAHDNIVTTASYRGAAAPGVGHAGPPLVILGRHVTVALKQEMRVRKVGVKRGLVKVTQISSWVMGRLPRAAARWSGVLVSRPLTVVFTSSGLQWARARLT